MLNEHFVSIKVDREERPDLDTIYMTALQVLTREGGGWPLSVFLTPDLTPFYAGTYFPPDDRYAPHRPSFKRLLAAIHDAWTNRRDHIREVGQNVAGLPPEHERPGGERHRAVTGLALERAGGAAAQLRLDARRLRHAPRSSRTPWNCAAAAPRPSASTTRPRCTWSGTRSTKMARGGMYDQLGGGFPRYSVDEKWLVPHFEKMLYDNALLTTAYVEAWQVTRDPFYAQIARETLDYVLARDDRAPTGRSSARRTPTARARRASSTSGARRKSATCSGRSSATSRARSGA